MLQRRVAPNAAEECQHRPDVRDIRAVQEDAAGPGARPPQHHHHRGLLRGLHRGLPHALREDPDFDARPEVGRSVQKHTPCVCELNEIRHQRILQRVNSTYFSVKLFSFLIQNLIPEHLPFCFGTVPVTLSSLVAAIAAEAMGAENVLGILMPSPYSSEHSISDALALVNNLGIKHDIIPIEAAMKAFDQLLVDVFANTTFGVAEENLQSRIRGNILIVLHVSC